MITITIDAKKVEAVEGMTVLDAAKAAGIHIPTLCHHPNLTPYGGCRLCLVEIEGARTLQPSCTMPASNGMVIKTNTEEIRATRRFVLDMIFSERNHFCPYCEVSGGDCELQKAAYEQDMTHWGFQPNWIPFQVDASHPYIIMDQNRCILCRRCVRACTELVGNSTLGFEERGAKSQLIADLAVPLGESSCISCGTCVQICPTGSLIDRWSAYRGLEKDVESHPTICVGCSIGCGIEVQTRNNQIVRIYGDWDAKINGGVICKVGRFEPLADQRERVTSPMVRIDGQLKKVSWQEALDLVTEKLRPLAGKSDGVVAIGSTRLSAESLHLLKTIFKDGLKASSVTTTEEGKHTTVFSKVAEKQQQSFEGTLNDVDQSDLFIIVGTDLVKEHEVAGFFVKRARLKDATLFVVDHSVNEMDSLADGVFRTEQLGEIARGLKAAMVKLGMMVDESIQPDAMLEAAVKATQIADEVFMKAAYAISSAKKPAVIMGSAISKLECVEEWVAFAKFVNASLVSMKGGANSLAAAQYQLDTPFSVNGHKVAYIALGDEEPTEKFTALFESVPFLAVQATYISKLTARADVVLPVFNWAEQSGHFVSMDGHVQESATAIIGPAYAKSNQQVLESLADMLGFKANTTWQSELHHRQSVVSIEHA
ncbi:molybdopterin-dependent oxidoreductase [Ornatilinea apprima]|uniref:molybdopterin-dependent oxidoreductase n=1 Tax=Ornatilinea apprima TaxID=1134406 RepID=UPI0009464A94|nr:molybdopterin-dependent oxidoreductase [Ornatilinea apprima]